MEQHCPITDWPPVEDREPRVLTDDRLRRDGDLESTAGPASAQQSDDPDTVWITAESLSDRDPAVTAHPGLPVVFVFDLPLLRRLQLSRNRLRFLTQSLADMATRREVEVWLGSPVEVLSGRRVAATFTPVPGWRSRAARLDIVETHPWPWLQRPHTGSVTSYTAWRQKLNRR